jgi:uncharacterized protein YaiI (UPF0178 family)
MNDHATTARPIEIFIDADACPVKEEVYRVARRYALKVHVVSNGGVRVPQEPLIAMVIVAEGPDAADDWIVEHVAKLAVNKALSDDKPQTEYRWAKFLNGE